MSQPRKPTRAVIDDLLRRHPELLPVEDREKPNKVCTHGSLSRKCELCERDERIRALEAALGEVLDGLERILRNEHLTYPATEERIAELRRVQRGEA